MSAVHYFYLTRWALRNDPALGFLMGYALLVTIDLHAAIKRVKRKLTIELIHAIIITRP